MKMELYEYRGHAFIVGASGLVLIHLGSPDGPQVAQADSIDAAMVAVDTAIEQAAGRLASLLASAILRDGATVH